MDVREWDLCCGCAVCAALCPIGAITMAADERGFYKPQVNSEQCVSCGLCAKGCPLQQAEEWKTPHLAVYGAQNADLSTRLQSSSGGVFSALAENILAQGGAVYGAVCEGKAVVHIRVTASAELPPLRGSKYVQSRLSPDIYTQLAADLTAARPVLFSGTPCQCAALRYYVKQRQLSDATLFLADFVCHGTPSRRVFADYIDCCEKKAKKPIKTHIFRTKDKGWGVHHEKNVFADGTEDGKSYLSQLYKRAFLCSYTLGEACFRCPFADTARVSDITMADFWGLDKSQPARFDVTGVSALLVNTPKGEAWLDAVPAVVRFDAVLEDLKQWHLYHPKTKPEQCDAFWEMYLTRGFMPAMKRFCGAGLWRRFLRGLIWLTPQGLKKFLKRRK